jgi:hypothetical protein
VSAQQKPRSKYIAQLSDEERKRLDTLIQSGKHRARQLLKARVLLKADESDAGVEPGDSYDTARPVLADLSALSPDGYCPANVMPSIRTVGESVPRRKVRSLAGVRLANICIRLPAMVISATGSARAPSRIMKPAAPRL